MKKYLVAACLVIAVSPVCAQTVKELARQVRESVVQLTVLDAAGAEVSGGTGFFIGPSLVATNQHVVDGALRVRATFSNGHSVEARGVAAVDEKNDLAILLLPDTLEAKILSLGVGPVEPGDRIVVVGNPLGLAGTISEGIVAAVRLDGLGPQSSDFGNRPLIQITAPISPGSSGSPVVNDSGDVIGVAVGYYAGGQNVNFAIPSRLLVDLRKATDGKPLARRLDSAASRWVLLRNLGISALFFAALFVAFRRMSSSGSPAPAARKPTDPDPKIKFRRRPGWGS